MTAILETLTDYEIDGLHKSYCLADGHAYQDLHPAFNEIIQNLPQIWQNAAEYTIPEMEQLFSKNFSSFINAPRLEELKKNFKICPTASNTIDIIGAVLNHLKYRVVMIEPTFDNLALLIRRRGVHLDSVKDVDLFQAAESNEIETVLPQLKKYDAVVLVHPNNPTGLILSENGFKNIVAFCDKNGITLIIDNCFRAYRRNQYEDYHILMESGVSFIAFEDTGKVWPTQDLKASIFYFSDDLKNIVSEVYNEIYLCVSNVTLAILSAFFDKTTKVGIKSTIWDVVDARRKLLREAIKDSNLTVTNVSLPSNLPVEWLMFTENDGDDFTICQSLKQLNLAVLPGRQFYWNSSNEKENQKYIRVSFMKKETSFMTGLHILGNYCKSSNKNKRFKLELAT